MTPVVLAIVIAMAIVIVIASACPRAPDQYSSVDVQKNEKVPTGQTWPAKG